MTDDTKQTYRYDFANNLSAVVRQTDGDTIGQYVFDGLGRRVRKVVEDVSDTMNGTTLYYYDGLR
jgi:hypothetical protein